MYCGDETGSFIGDVGSHTSRFGYGGEDSPKYVAPSYLGRSKDEATGGDKSNSKLKALQSCYQSKWCEEDCRAPLRLAQSPALSSSAEHPIVDPANYLQQGQDIADFDAYEQLWESAFETLHVRDRFKHTLGGGSLTKTTNDQDDKQGTDTRTQTDAGVSSTMMRPGIPENKCMHPLLAVHPGMTHVAGTSQESQASTHRKQLIQLTELLMEKLDCPAMFVAPAPMLKAFSHGRQTALVVDVGAGGCRVTPVVDGFLLKQSQRRNGRGGDWMGNVQWKALLDNKTVLRPRYQQQQGIQTVSQGKGIFHRWAMQDLMFELRTCSHVALPNWQSSRTPLFPRPKETEENENAAMETEPEEGGEDGGGEDDEKMGEENNNDASSRSETAIFELPDGTLIDLTTNSVGEDMRRVPELFFSEELPFLEEHTSASIVKEHASFSNLPLHQLIHSSLSAVGDVDTRKDLASSILLTGGSSLFAGLEERLSYEVSVQATYKTKVLASKYNVERSYASWIGGSILTSLGSFQQLWLGRTEYDEYGVTLAMQRFP